VTRERISAQLSQQLFDRLDERAAREGRPRSALIRDAVEAYLHDEERERIGREIVEGYERIPQTEEELAEADRDTREMLREEPW
jgi:metal-responsive CopG/Arc/MetJ family transcriptional regulator